MKIRVCIDYNSLLDNKIAMFAGRYLYFLKNPPKTDSEVPKYILFVYHLLGKGSLLYLRFVGYTLRIVEIISGKEILSKI